MSSKGDSEYKRICETVSLSYGSTLEHEYKGHKHHK